MFADLLGMFHTSPQGQNAFGVLQQQGFSPDQAQSIMASALPAAANAMHMATQGHPEPAVGLFNIFGGHAGSEFLMGAIAGVMRGDGFFGSVKDGFMGLIAGHVAEVVAQRTGMNPQMAGQVAAVLTPFLVHYAHERLSGHPAVAQQFGAAPMNPIAQNVLNSFQQGMGAMQGQGMMPQQGGAFGGQFGGGFGGQPQQGGEHHHHHHHGHHGHGDKYNKG